MAIIGLYGYYSQGNYGDDLMAVMTAVYLRQNGYECLVYGLRQKDKLDFNIDTTCDLDEFVAKSDAIVLAGGGLYITHNSPWPPVVDAYKQLGVLLEKCKPLNRPLFGLSLGGSGTAKFPEWQNSAITFTNQAKWVSVRNKEDLLIANRYQRSFAHFPDIVWCCSTFFPKNVSPMPSIRIGVYSAYAINRFDEILLNMFLRALSRLRRIELIIINDIKVFKRLSRSMRSKQAISCYHMCSLHDDTSLISSLDYVITSRLHVGISCMSYGGGMIALLPERKAVLALSDISLSGNIVSSRLHICFLLLRIAFAKDADYILGRFKQISSDIRTKRSTDAMRHFSTLLSQLNLCLQ